MVFELVYTSVLAPTADVLSFGDVIRRARSFNRESGITGILIFDGERFCQHLEGEQQAVLQLAARIAADPRHCQFTIVHQGTGGFRRRFRDWSLAYALDTRSTVLDSVVKAGGAEAIEVLVQKLRDLEIQPSSD